MLRHVQGLEPSAVKEGELLPVSVFFSDDQKF
jgi:hypothetical protein